MALFRPKTPLDLQRRPRLGFVDNLLTRPLVRGIEMLAGRVDMEGFSDGRVTELLAAGELDIALVPSIEVILHPDYTVIPTVCVGTFGGGGVAILCSKVLPTEIQSLLLDRDGWSLESLLRILLPRQGLSSAQLIRGNSALDETSYSFAADPSQAFLLTGIAALKTQNLHFAWTWDVLHAWRTYTNTPFVLWVWAVRPRVDLQGLDKELNSLLVRNLAKITELAAEESQRADIDAGIFTGLYTKVMHYTLDTPYMTGLRRFAKEACDARLAPGQAPIRPYVSR